MATQREFNRLGKEVCQLSENGRKCSIDIEGIDHSLFSISGRSYQFVVHGIPFDCQPLRSSLIVIPLLHYEIMTILVKCFKNDLRTATFQDTSQALYWPRHTI